MPKTCNAVTRTCLKRSVKPKQHYKTQEFEVMTASDTAFQSCKTCGSKRKAMSNTKLWPKLCFPTTGQPNVQQKHAYLHKGATPQAKWSSDFLRSPSTLAMKKKFRPIRCTVTNTAPLLLCLLFLSPWKEPHIMLQLGLLRMELDTPIQECLDSQSSYMFKSSMRHFFGGYSAAPICKALK